MDLIFKNAHFSLTTSTNDLSAKVRSLRLSRTYDIHDNTRMGHTAHSRITGLEDWRAEVTFLQNFASTENEPIDALLAAKVLAGVAFEIAMRPVNAARTSDNPEFRGNVVIESYEPMTGAVGDLLETTVPFLSAGNLSRLVSSS
jgi:hypothetical protein